MSIASPIRGPIATPLATAITAGGVGGGVSIVNDGVLAPFVTFTRASTATYFDSAGVMQTAAVNTPRIDYDPATLALRGLLIENQRTNLLLNSATLSTQSVTVTAVAHTLSFYGTGTITLSGASTAGPLVGTGANNRVTLTFTPTAGSLTLTVSGSVTMAQLEAGGNSTSYIPTTGTAQTRSADIGVFLAASIALNASEGALYSEASPRIGNTAPITLNDTITASSTANRISPYIGASHFGLIVTVAGVNQCVLPPAIANSQSLAKQACAWKLNDFAACVNGGAVSTDVSGTVPTVTHGHIGRQASLLMDGWIKTLRYYPRRLSNAELQAITA